VAHSQARSLHRTFISIVGAEHPTDRSIVGYVKQPLIGYEPQPGDVAVVPGPVGNTRGHMAMFNGADWVSDTVQRPGPNPFGNNPLTGPIVYYRRPLICIRYGLPPQTAGVGAKTPPDGRPDAHHAAENDAGRAGAIAIDQAVH